MAYNNGFPMGYQPAQIFYPQQYQPQQMAQPQYSQQPQQMPQQMPQPQSQPQNGGVIWVQGEAGAKSYLVAPNTTVQLWDSENQVIYLKSADASGMPSIKTLDYTIREMKQNPVGAAFEHNSVYATKEELDALRTELEGLIAATKRPTSAKTKKETEDNG